MAAAIDRFGPFTLDRDRRRLTANGRQLILSDRHFDVLLALTSQPGVVLSKEHLDRHGVARRRGGRRQPLSRDSRSPRHAGADVRRPAAHRDP